MTAGPPTDARIWLSPEAPGAIAEAVRRGGGELVEGDRANAIVWYGYSHLAPEQVPLARSLLRNDVRWVQLDSAGVEAWFEHGLVDGARVWTSAAGAYGIAVAEHVLAFVLAAAKRLPEAARSTTWRKPELEGRRLAGSTVGIVGAGAAGREVIRLLATFDVRILALTRSGRDVPGADRSLGPDGLDDLLASSDYVVLCTPLTPETEGLLGARQLELLGPEGVLVNVGRGGLVDTGALVEALRAGRLRGALLDVTDPEPLPDGHPLWSDPRVLITPHVANTRAQLDAALAQRVEENVARFRAGAALLGPIDPSAGY